MLQSTSKALIAAMLCGTLSACGGGGSSGSGSGGGSVDPSTFAEYEAYSAALNDELGDLSESLPTRGFARYNGVITAALINDALESEAKLAGDLTLNTDFARPSISGNVANIIDEDNAAYDGEFTIRSTSFDRTPDPFGGFTYEASLSGNITDPRGEQWKVEGDGEGNTGLLEGDFYGPEHTHTQGDVSGDLCSTTSGRCLALDGTFIAKQQ